MKKLTYRFNSSSTDFYFAYGISHLKEITDPKTTVLITDENILSAHAKRFKGWKTIVLKPGEEFKVQSTVDSIITQLLEYEADRKTVLVGVGGGVITDIAGYVASVYMRGLRLVSYQRRCLHWWMPQLVERMVLMSASIKTWWAQFASLPS
jgi:3-dehydroquinate synthase